MLVDEVVAGLAIRADGIYVDATFGRGGHAAAILNKLGPSGRLLALDRDTEAIRTAQARFGHDQRFACQKGRFSMLGRYIEDWGVRAQVNGIVLDLGVSSPQLDDPARGFSFRHAGPLDMRMDPQAPLTAADWINEAELDELMQVLFKLGEEKFSRRVAQAIVRERELEPITTTERLAAIIAGAVPTREPGKDPATRSFQAIRMHINDELGELAQALPQTLDALAPGGRLAVISFHSLEDRIVKNFIRDSARGDDFPPDLPVLHSALRPKLKPIGKAQHASATETARNPRARSAVLRVAERLAPHA